MDAHKCFYSPGVPPPLKHSEANVAQKNASNLNRQARSASGLSDQQFVAALWHLLVDGASQFSAMLLAPIILHELHNTEKPSQIQDARLDLKNQNAPLCLTSKHCSSRFFVVPKV
eukprot:3882421-Amphidinium_carterae.1